jgi:hypothetical protein
MTRWMKRRIEKSRARCQRMTIKITYGLTQKAPRKNSAAKRQEAQAFVAGGSKVAILQS